MKINYAAISHIFYCFYHSFLAIAAKFGYESGNQTCTISLIEHLKNEGKINIDEKYIEMMKYEDNQKGEKQISIIGMREEYTYGTKFSIDEEKIKFLAGLSKDLIQITKEIVYSG